MNDVKAGSVTRAKKNIVWDFKQIDIETGNIPAIAVSENFYSVSDLSKARTIPYEAAAANAPTASVWADDTNTDNHPFLAPVK